MQRTGQARGLEYAGRPVALKHFDCEIAMKYQLAARADALEKFQCLDVASHQHVLAVVDEIAGLRVGERVGAAAQRRLAFEHGNAKASPGKRHGSAQTGEPAADHDDVARLDHRCLAPRSQSRAGPRAANQVELARGGETIASANHAAAIARDPLEQRVVDGAHRFRTHHRGAVLGR